SAEEALALLRGVAPQLGEQPYWAPVAYARSDRNRLMQWHNLATTNVRLGRYHEAFYGNDQALAFDPDDGYVLITREAILGEMGTAAREAAREEDGRRLQEMALGCLDNGLAGTPVEDVERRRGIHSMRARRLGLDLAALLTPLEQALQRLG